MSFILDALKKSESDRQRQSGPALYEVKVAPPRSGLPPWAVAVVILLAVNLMIGLWMLLRHPGAHAESATPVAAPLAAAVAVPPAAVASQVAPGQNTAPLPVPAAAPGAVATNTVSAPVAALPIAPPGAGAESAHADPLTPEDYAPAAEPTASSSAFSGHVRRGTGDGVPLYQDASVTPGNNIPPLRLDLHAYAVRPQDRFVMINMHKVHEGDMLPEGVRVESITPEGAVLSYKGANFLLPRD